MSIAKLKAFNSPDMMKTDEGNDSLDTIIRQSIGKEPFLSFSRPVDSSVQWIQYLHTLDSQEIPGWPFFSPVKIQMLKCDKCSREFCSTVNYRRHIRAYHRLKRVEKDFTKNRELLVAFWDKLSSEEAQEVVSFKNGLFEEIPGSAIIKNLTALIRKPGFSALPLVYLKAGSVLLDIVQSRPSRFPIFSHELFGVLDDASEKTFLCGGATSMQKYIFDGEAAKISLETKNLVACLSFLVEQKLVKAWLEDKDAEALRCQKLLVEEEEAAHKRQAALLERKRQKKLRQKEQKAKDQRLEEKEYAEESMDTVSSTDLSNPSVDCNPESHNPPSFEIFQHSITRDDKDSESHMEFSSYTELDTDMKTQKSGHKQLDSRWQVFPRSQRRVRNGFHSDQNSQASRINRRCSKELKSAPGVNGNKVWSRKPKLKPENSDDRWKVILQKEEATTSSSDQLKSHEVLIGSISVMLGNRSHEDGKSIVSEKAAINGTNSMTVKLWRPVSQNSSESLDQVQNVGGESGIELIASKPDDRAEGTNGLPFSVATTKAFLSQRWKEAMMAEHVKLVLSPVEEKQSVAGKILGSRTAGVSKPKFRVKPEKNAKIKYIPKQRSDRR